MGENTKIEWATHTFNPWLGCTNVSPACDHCYAEAWAKRAGDPQLWQGQRRRTTAANWKKPLKWNREVAAAGVRARVFCASLADVFDNQVPRNWRRDLFELIVATPNLDWLLLTKRIGNAAKMIDEALTAKKEHGQVLPNVWLGSTVVTQEEADRDIPKLLATPARIRFLSIEPMLGPINLRCPDCGTFSDMHALTCSATERAPLAGIDWVIVGGESGGGARPMIPGWARSLRDQCADAGVAFLFKQWGEFAPDDPTAAHTAMRRVGKHAAGRLLDGIEHNGFPT